MGRHYASILRIMVFEDSQLCHLCHVSTEKANILILETAEQYLPVIHPVSLKTSQSHQTKSHILPAGQTKDNRSPLSHVPWI